jgi:hypothetical protein
MRKKHYIMIGIPEPGFGENCVGLKLLLERAEKDIYFQTRHAARPQIPSRDFVQRIVRDIFVRLCIAIRVA